MEQYLRPNLILMATLCYRGQVRFCIVSHFFLRSDKDYIYNLTTNIPLSPAASEFITITGAFPLAESVKLYKD